MRIFKLLSNLLGLRKYLKFQLNLSGRWVLNSTLLLTVFSIIFMLVTLTELVFLLREKTSLTDKEYQKMKIEKLAKVFKKQIVSKDETKQDLQHTLSRVHGIKKHEPVVNLKTNINENIGKISSNLVTPPPVKNLRTNVNDSFKIENIGKISSNFVTPPVNSTSRPKPDQLQAPNIEPTIGSWQTVRGTSSKFFVFAAYYETREARRKLRIIAATQLFGPDRVWCRMWLANGSHLATIKAKLQAIRENWSMLYSAFYVFCPLNKDQTLPHSVSIVKDRHSPATNRLLVQNMKQNYNQNNPDNITMSLCVQPLHNYYDKTLWLLEFLEYYRLVGVNHAVFYNHTLGASVSCVLHDYAQRGLVTVLPWQLDMVSEKEIRMEGIFAALNDCLYRTMYRFTHAVMLDLDEFVVPQHNNTLHDLIRWIDPLKKASTYIIKNAFFYLQWPDDLEEAKGIERKMVTMTKTRRMTRLHPYNIRSKYICRTEFTKEVGNHFIYEYMGNHSVMNVPEEKAIMHHYRVCEFGGDDCVQHPSVIDKKIYRYRQSLTENIKRRWNELKTKCQLPDL